ncbi:hypothetical protein TNCV_2890021 [Trichonephila clavipes]|nr:hypothetical protein TNCV_2890021 [Trichonephila clavipes]
MSPLETDHPLQDSYHLPPRYYMDSFRNWTLPFRNKTLPGIKPASTCSELGVRPLQPLLIFALRPDKLDAAALVNGF